MVLIAFDKKHDLQKIISYLTQKSLTVYDEYWFDSGEWGALNDMRFFEIETENLAKNGLCCFGNGIELNNQRRGLEELPDANAPLYILTENGFEKTNETVGYSYKRVIRLYEEDIAFWLSFIREFTQKYGKLMVMSYYDDVSVPSTTISLSADKITQEDLLNIDVNQGLLIRE